MKEEKEERQELKRTTKKVKHQLRSKIRELDDRESQLFLKFLDTQSNDVLKLNEAELVWTFIMFLKTSGYHILHKNQNIIFCMPLSKMIKLKDL